MNIRNQRHIGRGLALSLWALPMLASAAATPQRSLADWFAKVPPPTVTTQATADRSARINGRKLSCELPEQDAFLATLREEIQRVEEAEREASSEASAISMSEAMAGQPELQARMQQQQAINASMESYQAKMMEIMPKIQAAKTQKERDAYMAEIEKISAQMQAAAKGVTAGVEKDSRKAKEKKAAENANELPEVLKALEQLSALKREDQESLYPGRLEDLRKSEHDQLRETFKQKGPACYGEHVKLSDQQLRSLPGDWKLLREKLQARAARYDKILAPVQYGAKAKLPGSREKLLETYLRQLKAVEDLAEADLEICVLAASWSKSQERVRGTPDYACDAPGWFKYCGPESIGRDYTAINLRCKALKGK